MKRKIRLLRNAVNLGVIFTNPEMLEKVTAAASATGPASGLTTALLAEAWAYAEAYNDVKILENGGKIPVIKTKETWAVDLESVLKNDADGISIIIVKMVLNMMIICVSFYILQIKKQSLSVLQILYK